MRQLLKILPFILNSAFVPAANGATAEQAKLIYVKPVEILNQSEPGSERQLIRVAFEQACGESFHGVLVNESAKETRIGVAVFHPTTQCSALPVRQELVIPVATSHPVESIATRESRRIVLQEVLDVAVSGHELIATWQDACRKTLGLLISPVSGVGAKKYEIYIAELPDEPSALRSKSVNCSREVRRGSLGSVKIKRNDLLLGSRPGHLSDMYSLRLRASSDVSLSTDGQLAISYDYNCREQPVGVLFTGQSGNDVAMLMAYAPNSACGNTANKRSTYRVNSMRVAPGQKITALSAAEIAEASRRANFNFRLMPVTSIKTTRQGSGDWLLAGAPLSCAERLGIVAGEDSLGNFSMASVVGGRDAVCELSHIVSGQTLTAPLVGPADGPMAKVFALKVFGTPAN